jgi:hypothetical protein
MKLKIPLAIALLVGSFHVYSTAWAEGGNEHEQGAEQQAEDHGPGGAMHGGAAPHGGGMVHGGGGRAAPFQGGGFRPAPHPIVPAPHPAFHPAHVYNPYVIHRGAFGWARWAPTYEWVRPTYYFEWDRLRVLTCMSEDSYGDQYPVTESGYHGPMFRDQLGAVEDASLSRCYDESGHDPQCRLITCTPGY